MEYRECQEWVQWTIETYERLLDDILQSKSLEEVKRKIKEFRSEESESTN
mgnify:CR=1 FL=1